MRTIFFLLSALLLTSNCIAEGANDRLVSQCKSDEAAALAKSPRGAQRLNETTLTVKWQKGVKKFKDVVKFVYPSDGKPYKSDDGTHWTYCGFIPQVGMHHIQLNKFQDRMTGVLLDDVSGKTLPAGDWILFSLKQKFYLSNESTGADGMSLTLRDAHGLTLWTGYNYFEVEGKTGYKYADIENIRANENEEFEGAASCIELDKKQQVKLTLSHGQWGWSPKIVCTN